MKLYRYELKKILTARWLTILFAVMLLFHVGITWTATKATLRQRAVRETYDLYLQNPQELESYREELEQLALLHIRDEEYRLPATYCPGTNFDDLVILEDVLARAEYVEGHSTAMERLKIHADRRIADLEWYGFLPDDYEIRAEKQLGDTYMGLTHVVDPRGEYAYGYDAYLSCTWVILFCLLFSTMVAVHVFQQEKADGSALILRATRRGRLSTVLAKMAASVTLCLIGSLLFLCTTALVVGLACGYSSPFQAVQALPTLSTVPYAWTMLEYLLIHGLLCLLACAVYSLAISAAAAMRLSYVGGLAVGTIFAGIQAVLFLYPYEGTPPAIRYLNLAALLEGDVTLSFYRTVAVGNIPVTQILVLVVGSLLAVLALGALTAFLFCHRITVCFPVRIKKWFSRFKLKSAIRSVCTRRCGMPLWFYELKKTRFGISLMAILLLLTAKCSYLYATAGDMERYEEAQYRQYIATIQAMSPADREAYMTEERERLDAIISVYGEKKTAFEFGELDSESYYAYLKDYYQASSEDVVFTEVEQYVSYIEGKNEATGLDGEILYTRGYEAFFGFGTDWFLFAALLVLCGNVFAVEYRKNSSRGQSAAILRATAGGRNRTATAKFGVYAIVGLALALLFRVAGLAVIAGKYALPNPGALLYTIQSFAWMDSGMTIGGYFAMDLLLQAVGGGMLALLIVSASALFRRLPLTLCALLLAVGLPEVLIDTIWQVLRGSSLLSLTRPQELTKLSCRVELWNGEMTLLILVTTGYMVLTGILTAIAWRAYTGPRLSRRKEG